MPVYNQRPTFKKESKNCFEFPEGGWECNKCKNYNFKGRKECFRCKKQKSMDDVEGKPEHMLKPIKKSKRSEKDWICPCCQNHNYSFRKVCNKC